MNAKEFIKQYGWDLAKRDVVCLGTGFITKADFLENYGFEILDDLKQLVDAWELVEKVGGIEKAKMLLRMRIAAELYDSADEIEQAIELVENVNE